MRILAALVALLQCVAVPVAVQAQEYTAARTVVVERWVEEWDPATQRWVEVADDAVGEVAVSRGNENYDGVGALQYTYVEPSAFHNAARYAVAPTVSYSDYAIAQYGPFQVLGNDRAAIIGPTDRMSLHYFDAMLRDFPGIDRLEMIEAPGTSDDIANLAVGRRIRAEGISTHVPHNGSVRSGAVELFLAGETRTMDDGAEFAVHSWLDNYGREPNDFAPDAPENRLYLDYYEEMGMSDAQARAFYAMTNSVPHRSAKWLGADEMRGWLVPQTMHPGRERAIAWHDRASHRPHLAYAQTIQVELARLDSQAAFP